MLCIKTPRLWHAGTLIALFYCATARAQVHDPVTSRTLDVTIGGAHCLKFPDEISVVMDDEDGSTYHFPITGGPGCHWTGKALGTFDASLTHFSLRLGIARTDCRTVEETYKDPAEGLMRVARLTFECCAQDLKPVQQVTISTDRPVSVSYLRRVPKSRERGRLRSVPCTEHAVFTHGTGTIDHVQFQSETLRLQLGEKVPKPESPGLLIRVPTFKKGKKANYPLHLDRDDVVSAFIEQRAQGEAGDPNLSSNAIEIDYKRLKEAGVKTLDLTVQ